MSKVTNMQKVILCLSINHFCDKQDYVSSLLIPQWLVRLLHKTLTHLGLVFGRYFWTCLQQRPSIWCRGVKKESTIYLKMK